MSIKGAIQPNHIPVNKYRFLVVGLPPLTPTKIDGIEEELEAVDLPDRTRASGGNTKPVEFSLMLPAHHAVEQAAMEAWFKSSQDPVLPGYKKAATLLITPINGGAPKPRTLVGVFPTKRKDPDLEMKNEGDMAEVQWTLSADDII
jgi:hypothetical protein